MICLFFSLPITGIIPAEKIIHHSKHHSETIKPLNQNVNLLVYYCDKNQSFKKHVVTMKQETFTVFKRAISDISNKDLSLIELFEIKLNLMKQYDVINDDVRVNDILDISDETKTNLLNFSIINAEKFDSIFSPVFIAGMGMGIGIGFRRMPIRQHLAGNLYSAGLIGLGAVLCLDIQDQALYYQFTFTYPFLIHIISGFIGIMLFAFDSLYPPDNGPPITIYSNFFALGMAGLVIGFEI